MAFVGFFSKEFLVILVIGIFVGMIVGIIIARAFAVSKREIEKKAVKKIMAQDKIYFKDGKEIDLKKEIAEELGSEAMKKKGFDISVLTSPTPKSIPKAPKKTVKKVKVVKSKVRGKPSSIKKKK